MMWNALVSGAAGARVDRDDRRQPAAPRPALAVAARRGDRRDADGREPRLPDGVPQGGRASRRAEFDLSRLRQIGAAGSPLPPEGYRWVAEQFGPDVLLNVGSGGTDVCSGIVQGSPLQPVWAGEISGPCLGVDAQAFDEKGDRVVGELGELVITAPMPSMPVGFWGDPDGTRYRDTYFDVYPGVWRHGDWVRFSAVGSAVIAGPLRRHAQPRRRAAGHRRVLPGGRGAARGRRQPRGAPGGPGGRQRGAAALRRSCATGCELDDALRRRIATALRTELSPRHIPDGIAAVPVVPRNRTGKKLELPAKRILLGAALGRRRQPRRPGRPDVARRRSSRSPAARRPGMSVQRVAVVGTGVIGASWAAHFLAHGLDVVATDPAPGAEERLRADVAAHWPRARADRSTARRRTGCRSPPTPAEAVADADFVQENGPEREDVKHALFAVLDEAARPEVVLASSSSGLLPSAIARGCPRHPERVLIGHPFNPPHLIPLVEVVPGEKTAEEAVDAAMAFYTAVGKRPIRLRQELPGHVANRLQAALWQEAYSLVDRGVATVADIDTAIAHGPGLRWAVLGPFAQPAPVRRARAASRTSSSTSARRPRRGGATSGRSRSPPSSSPSSSPGSTRSSPASTRPSWSPAATPCSPPCSPPRLGTELP